MQVVVYTKDGEKKKEISIPDGLFDLPWNEDLVAQVTRSYALNQRQGSAHAKDRSEVRGGGRKPWRQKGTGRARHGSIRSPIWVGGGVTFGPRKEKKYAKKINQKMKTKAFFVSLSGKFREGEVFFVDDLGISSPKTKTAKSVLDAFAGSEAFGAVNMEKKNAILIVTTQKNEAVVKSFANIGNVDVKEVREINASDVLSKKMVIFTDPEKSIEILEARAGIPPEDKSAPKAKKAAGEKKGGARKTAKKPKAAAK